MDLRVCISEFSAVSTDFKGGGTEHAAGVMLMTTSPFFRVCFWYHFCLCTYHTQFPHL